MVKLDWVAGYILRLSPTQPGPGIHVTNIVSTMPNCPSAICNAKLNNKLSLLAFNYTIKQLITENKSNFHDLI